MPDEVVESGESIEDTAWRLYERQIYDSLKELVGDEGTVEFDQKRLGRLSGVIRQVDVWVTGSFAGGVETAMTAAVDCKNFSRKIDVKAVEAFMGLVRDVGADLGIMITSSGYSKAAERRVEGGTYRLRVVPKVEIVDVDELDRWNFGWDDYADEYEKTPPSYVGDFYDYTPYGDYGTSVEYVAGFASATLLSGREIRWADDDERRSVIGAIMEHHLGYPPDADAVDGFLEDYRERLVDGLPFEFDQSEVAHMAY